MTWILEVECIMKARLDSDSIGFLRQVPNECATGGASPDGCEAGDFLVSEDTVQENR
jgi:hypothetical protein